LDILNNNPYIIAEAGVNHNGEISASLRLVDIARAAGADCIKFQAFSAEELTIKNSPKAEYQKIYDNEKNQQDMLLKYELKENELKEIKQYCDSKNIDFLVTPFSSKWVKILYNLDIKMFKISSGSIGSLELLKEIGRTGLPVILSTGMSVVNEIRSAIDILKDNGCKELSLLHCVSLYPVHIEKINLFSIQFLKDEFNLPVGFSDHTREIETGGLAVAAGAGILEKHFTINNKLKGPDHQMSLLPNELKDYIEKARRISIICGKKEKRPLEEELEMKRVVQTSIVAKRFIKKNEKILKNMLTEKRPGTGISSLYIDNIIGRIANKDIELDEILTYGDLK